MFRKSFFWKVIYVKKKNITIEDIAKLSGVSRGTISRVLNGSKSVNSETRKLVLDVIEKVCYQPNVSARKTAGGRSYSIGIVIPMIGTEFYERLLKSMESLLRQQWYVPILFPLLRREWLSKITNFDIPAADVEGVIFCSMDIERLYMPGRIPTDRTAVLVDSFSPLYDSVYVNNEHGGYIAGKKLLEYDGEVQVIMMHETVDTAYSPVFHSRLKGFKKALQEGGKFIPPENIQAFDFSWSAGSLAARNIFSSSKPPYNIFAMSDLYAFGVVKEAQLEGLEIGKDVRIVGYDDQSIAKDWGITTVRQPIEEMGDRAVNFLIERLKGFAGTPRNVALLPELINRDSA